MHQAIESVHGGGHVLAIRSQSGLLFEPQPTDVRLQLLSQVAAADDQKAGGWNLAVNPGRRLEELALPFAPRAVVTADEGKGEVIGREAPFGALRCGVEGPKTASVYAAVDHADLRNIPQQRGAGTALWFRRLGFIHAFAQYPGYEMGHRHEGVALAKQKSPAEPRTGTLRKVSRQNNFWTDAREPRREDRGPQVAAMVAVDELKSAAPDQFGGVEHEPEFKRAFGRQGVKWRSQLARDARKLAAIGAGEQDFRVQLAEAVDKFHAVVIRPASLEQRVEVEDAQRLGGTGFHLGNPH
jgi:hypothetical protein